MIMLQVITGVQMRSLIKLPKWKCHILNQFYKGYVIHVRQFRYGQERKQWEKKEWTVPPVNMVIFQHPIGGLCKKVRPLKNVPFVLRSIFHHINGINGILPFWPR